jgi:hypothetical protein
MSYIWWTCSVENGGSVNKMILTVEVCCPDKTKSISKGLREHVERLDSVIRKIGLTNPEGMALMEVTTILLGLAKDAERQEGR